MAETTPRITAPYLEAFSHSTVRMLGKVRQLRGESATIDAGGSVNVFLNRVRSSYSLFFVLVSAKSGRGFWVEIVTDVMGGVWGIW